MSKVCLINPILFSTQVLRTRSFKNNVSMSFFPPLGLAYIAGFLEKNGIEVMVIDRNVIMRKYSSELEAVNQLCMERIRLFSPDYVGITSTTPTYLDVKNYIAPIIKEYNSNIKIILGGPHATALTDHILRDNRNIDMVCRGEGEVTMLEIAQGSPSSQIKGLSFRNGGQITHNVERPFCPNIDDFYPPARHLMDMDSYCQPSPHIMHGLYMRATTILTSRGCPYNCTFCAGKVALGQMVRFQTNELIVDEIKNLIKDYGIEGLYFADDVFEANKSRVTQICGMMIDSELHKEVKWIAQVRANTVDTEILKIMKDAGCIRLEFGFETGSQKVLDILNKKTTVQQNYNAAKIAKKIGLPFQANIIVGMPGEDIEDLRQTKKFMRDIKSHWIGFGEFTPLPGSKLYDDLLNDGKISVEAVEKLRGFNVTNLSDEEFKKYIKNIKRTIVIPTRIKNFFLDNTKTIKGCIYVFKFILKAIKYQLLLILNFRSSRIKA